MKVLRDKNVIARKHYKCMLCNGNIEKGEKYNRQTIIYDGEIFDCNCHIHCISLIPLLEMDGPDDYIYEDDFIDSIREYAKENHPDWDLNDIAKCARKIYEELNNELKYGRDKKNIK